jgi:hypothetical protein
VELSVKPILESPINLNSTATTLIQQAIWSVAEIWVKTNLTGIKTICFVLMRHKQTFSWYFESLDETNAENIRKQYNTIVLPLYQGFIDEENQITCYTDHQILNAIINLILQLFEKQNIT